MSLEIREIGFLQVHTRYLLFCFKKTGIIQWLQNFRTWPKSTSPTCHDWICI